MTIVSLWGTDQFPFAVAPVVGGLEPPLPCFDVGTTKFPGELALLGGRELVPAGPASADLITGELRPLTPVAIGTLWLVSFSTRPGFTDPGTPVLLEPPGARGISAPLAGDLAAADGLPGCPEI